jgi:predicted amidohydrolase YtcJ
MKSCTRRILLQLTILLLALAAVPALASTALVLHNANIYTGDISAPRAEAILIVDGRIAYVGAGSEALRRAPPEARKLELGGLTVLPGMTDSHAHLSGIGWRELYFDLTGVESLAAMQRRLRERAAGDRSAWLVGRGWIESRWTPAAFPAREDLDAVVPDRPVVLERIDGHAIVVNSLALKIAGITRETPNPGDGEVLKNPMTGEPTGMLIDGARALVEDLIPPPTDAETKLALETGANRSVRVGWTQLQYAGTSDAEIRLLCELYAEEKINLRVYAAIEGPSADAERLLAGGRRTRECDDRLVVRGIKLYMDGALGSRGAALLAPYSDSPVSTGLLRNDPDEVLRIATAALKRGIQVETHAIGDRGNRIVLDIYEKAFASVPPAERPVAEPRFRIEHAQVLAPSDIPRFAKLGVIASMQTSHAISDMFFAPQRLGPERLKGAYAWRSLLDSGAILTGGSDAPVEQGDPIVEFYAAVTRRTLDGYAGPDWGLEQHLTREEALRLLTYWPAYAAFQETERGTIEIGKLADLTVLSADIMQVPEAEILKARVTYTIIGGKVAYESPWSQATERLGASSATR